MLLNLLVSFLKLFTPAYDGDTGQGDGGDLGDDPGNMDDTGSVSDEGNDGGWANNPNASGPEDGRDFSGYGDPGYGDTGYWGGNTGVWGGPEVALGPAPVAPGPMDEEAFQALQDYQNWAGYKDNDQSKGINTLDDLMGRETSWDAHKEYQTMGLLGKLTDNPWGYTDFAGKGHANFGSIGRDALGVLGSPIGQVGLSMAGFGPAALTASVLNNILQGNYGNAFGGIGSLFGGQGALAGSVLGNLATGRNQSAMTSIVNAGLQNQGISLGSLFGNNVGNPGSLESALASLAGAGLQGAGLNAGLGALGFNNQGGGLTGPSTSGYDEDSGYQIDQATIQEILEQLTQAEPTVSTKQRLTRIF